MIEGQCNCGAVAFEIKGDASQIIVCHCSICRNSTGSNGIPVILFAKNVFRWIKGEDKVCMWQKPDADWKKWFCRVCASPLPGENDENTMFAPAGVLSDTSMVHQTIHHIWVNSKARWDKISDDGTQHPGAFESNRLT